jgi:transcriptional regulator with XRE-family HTH domain
MKIDSIKLRKFRDKHRLSQQELAASLGLSQATIWEWEQGDKEIKLEYFAKMLEIYGKEVYELSKDGNIISFNNHEMNNLSDKEKYAGNNDFNKELIENLKEDNAFFKQSIILIMDKMTDLINKIK